MLQINVRGLWRVVDANQNRASEGLRVCEDIVRFLLNDAAATAALKSCRHHLARIFTKPKFERRMLLAARESARDVGKKSFLQDEKKPGWKSLLSANFKRTEESLRVLEECAKIVMPGESRQFQALRFRVYGLEKKLLVKL